VSDLIEKSRLDLSAYLPYRLSILSNTVSSAIAALYEQKHQLSVADWRIMAVLGMEPDRALTQTELCSRTRMDKVQVSRAIKRLLNMGHVDRIMDPKDKRRAYLTLTKPGQRVYDDVAPITLAWERAFLSRLSKADAQTLDVMLTLLQTIADEMSVQKPCPPSEP